MVFVRLFTISVWLFVILGFTGEQQPMVSTQTMMDKVLLFNATTPAPSSTPNLPTGTPSPTPTATPIVTAIVQAKQAVNVRQGHSTDTPIIGKLLPKETVQVLDQNDDGTWLHILTASNLEGWVSASLLSINEVSTQTVAESTPTPEPIQPTLDTHDCQPNMRKLGLFRLDSVNDFGAPGVFYDYTPVLESDYSLVIVVSDSLYPNDYDEMYNLEARTTTIRGITVQYGFSPDLFGTPYADLGFDFTYQGKFYSGEILDIASEVRSARKTLLDMLDDLVMSITTC